MSISAMKQALEALERGRSQIIGALVQQDQDEAITALRQAIEQAEKQEPVGWLDSEGRFSYFKHLDSDEPLYAAPVHARPVVHAVRCTYPQCQATNGCVGACSKGQAEKQEPVVGTKTWFEDGKMVTQHLYASDISQERVDETAKCGHKWVGLTDEEIQVLADPCKQPLVFRFSEYARAIEDKLKEKNA